MTYSIFHDLHPEDQLSWVLRHGRLLASRPGPGTGIQLYHVANRDWGFLAEVGQDEVGEETVLRHFERPESLADYSDGVQLPSSL